jgi:hypothetical protein
MRRTSGQSVRNFQQSSVLSDIWEKWVEKYFYVVLKSLKMLSNIEREKLGVMNRT